MKSELSAFFVRCRINDKEVIIHAKQVFHDYYSTIVPMSHVRIVSAKFQGFSTVGYCARVVPVLVPHSILPIFFEYPIFV